MKRTKPPIALAGLTVSVLALQACSGGASPSTSGNASGGTAVKGGTVTVLQTTDFSYLDPARGFDGGVNAFYRLVYRTLITKAANDAADPNAMVPDLAEGLGQVSADGLTWTYKIKDGVKFDTGAPITAQDVKFGISRAWDPEIGIGAPYLRQLLATPATYQGPYQSGENPAIETPDDKTVVFKLKAPFPEFDAVLSMPSAVPFPVGTGAGTTFINDIVASGPYDLDTFTPGSTIKLKRNPNWDAATDTERKAYPDAWNFAIGIDGATIDERLIAGQGADVNAMAGSVQTATIARLQTPQLQDRVVKAPSTCLTYVGLNTSKKNLSDVRVRQAINLAVDKTSLLNATGGNQFATIASTIIPSNVSGHADYDLYPSTGNTGDIEKAKALLTEAGLPNGFTLTLDIRTRPVAQAQGEAIQQSLKRVGIDVKLNVIDAATYYETIATPSQQHDAAITGWCPDWASSASTFLPPLFDGRQITDKGNQNLAQLNDVTVNAEIDRIKALTDLAEANKAWGELDQKIMELAPVVPVNVENRIYLPGSNVAGLVAPQGDQDYAIIGLKDASKG
ncbi:ABC transporter substrate-binding protein [Actinoplanes derwentensis]|uniref:Peptide/nickel transport system substrate-binding protein n=1 Tax=Actinoplanes derwentensis TaxID=113562 RepID=A0A1H1VZY5_9ACTN|nr:ABC transporter substrate-binding protein [Actinoplanes derwentensis]GID84002.1 ABC transporter substrate-binding protein [Actinoplanes derwentensis]SDS90312.1 peptide/nickel transport system substrate-binding protein [Actinoplanes derwentensis]